MRRWVMLLPLLLGLGASAWATTWTCVKDFQVVQEGDKAPLLLAWKDTVNVPRKSQTRIAWLPDDRPGEWMYHCHILEHHAAGMMAHFEVVR